MTELRGSGGGGGKNGGNRTPTEADDSLQSIQYAKVLDLLSEGPIQGLDDGNKSIYLDGTPVQDASGTDNFEGYSITTRTGTQDQTYISDLAGNESEVGVGIQVTNSTPVTRQIAASENTTDRVRVTIKVPVLRHVEDDGDIVGNSVQIRIDVQYNGGGYNAVKTDTISGKSSNTYLRDYLIPLTGDFPVDIKVVRLSADDSGVKNSSQTWWNSYTKIIDEKFRYPNSAIAFLRFDSRSFQNIPSRKYKIRGIKVKIPSNATVITAKDDSAGIGESQIGRLTYSGIWDGSFQAATWCADPAWCLYDLMTNARYGVGLPESTLDKWDFYTISKYCNELVSDMKGGQEPRMLCNLLINSRNEVYNVIQQMTSLFRGISYYGAGSVVMVQDAPQDSQYLIGNSNVLEGLFTYSGTSQRARHTTCSVAWQDYAALGEVQFEYVEDADAIAKYGIQEKQVKALGCYSQGQAHRMGRWLLKSEQLLTQTVNFSVGIDSGLVLRPGMVIDIADELRAGERRSGRISSATTTAIVADSSENLSNINLGLSPTLSVIMPTGLVETKTINSISGTTINIDGNFSEAPTSPNLWLIQTSDLQSQQYRVISVAETNEKSSLSVTALEYNASIYNAVDAGEDIVLRDISNLTLAPNPITNARGEQFLYSDGQGVFVGFDFDFQHDKKNVSEYRISYKIDNDNWQLITTSTPSATIRRVREGTIYIQVQAYNTLGKGSQIVTFEKLLEGKSAPPSDPTGFSMVPTNGLARLSWTQSTDLDVTVGGLVRLRHSPNLSNVTWATATSIHSDLTGTAKEAYATLKGGTYLMKFVDATGNESVGYAGVEFTMPDLDDMKLLTLQQEDGGFAGTKTNLTVDSGELLMATDGGSSGGNATLNTSGTYLFQNNPIDLGDVFSIRLDTTLRARSFFPYADNVDTWADWDAITSVDGTAPSNCDVKLYVRTTQEASPSNSDWTSWRVYNNAQLSARKYELKAEFTTGGNLEQIAVDQLRVQPMMAVRTETGSGTTSSSGDLTVTFANKFAATPAIGITFSATTTGDYYTIASSSATTFAISIYNASNARQARAFTWTATGHGKVN
tara:strand:+ start:5139 stop:8384 length:3246 start_codon:yes stop_codon:yes gene_type:complete